MDVLYWILHREFHRSCHRCFIVLVPAQETKACIPTVSLLADFNAHTHIMPSYRTSSIVNILLVYTVNTGLLTRYVRLSAAYNMLIEDITRFFDSMLCLVSIIAVSPLVILSGHLLTSHKSETCNPRISTSLLVSQCRFPISYVTKIRSVAYMILSGCKCVRTKIQLTYWISTQLVYSNALLGS